MSVHGVDDLGHSININFNIDVNHDASHQDVTFVLTLAVGSILSGSISNLNIPINCTEPPSSKKEQGTH